MAHFGRWPSQSPVTVEGQVFTQWQCQLASALMLYISFGDGKGVTSALIGENKDRSSPFPPGSIQVVILNDILNNMPKIGSQDKENALDCKNLVQDLQRSFDKETRNFYVDVNLNSGQAHHWFWETMAADSFRAWIARNSPLVLE